MRGVRHDLTGLRFGRLVAKEYVCDSKWRCVCDCGTERAVLAGNLLGGQRSCGCLRRDKNRERISTLTAAAAEAARVKREAIKKAIKNYPTHPIVSELRRARIEQEIAIPALADMAGYSQTLISLVETGKLAPKITMVADLANALGFDVKIGLEPKRDAAHGGAND